MTDLYRLLPEEMEELVIELGQPRFRADQILYALYYKFPKDLSEIKQLPTEFREKLVEGGYTVGSTKEVHRVESEDGDTTKLLLNLNDETPVESVLMQYKPKKCLVIQGPPYVFQHKLVVPWDVYFVRQDKWALKEI